MIPRTIFNLQFPICNLQFAIPKRASVWRRLRCPALGAVLLVLAWLPAAGRARSLETDQPLETQYGRRTGAWAATSINGTAVLGRMFTLAGHKVSSAYALSPRLKRRADCIVWFPDDFRPPSQAACEWLEDWLDEAPDRTLIYVGRDFDATAMYWEKVIPHAPDVQHAELRREMEAAREEFRLLRRQIGYHAYCPWFEVEDRYPPRKVRTLEGEDFRWLEGIDPLQFEIQLNGRMIASDSADVLLGTRDDAVVTSEALAWDGSRVIVVANGSFLLNLPLVNHEHRKLAGKLIDEVGPSGKTVVFLESGGGYDYGGGAGRPLIVDEDDEIDSPSPFELLWRKPVCWVFLHLGIAGILFCFVRWPIFGAPRELQTGDTSDFGKHIEALAKLLQRSGDKAYAMTRLLHYRQITKGNE